MNDIKKKKFFDNFILVFILMQPFIDALTCIQIKSNLNIFSSENLIVYSSSYL